MASHAARLPHSLPTLQHTSKILEDIEKLVKEHDVTEIIIGLPRGLEGQRTEQTKRIEAFARGLKAAIKLPVHFQDEALTSRQAEEELRARQVAYTKEAVDALAALYILEDFLRTASVREEHETI